jgi:lysophospholipase L1-like esterase
MKSLILVSAVNLLSLGDSISTGVNADPKKVGEALHLSWAIGGKIDSFLSLLEKTQEVNAITMAVAGSETPDILRQLELGLERMPMPDFVLISIGGNDLCRNADIDTAVANVARTVDLIHSNNPMTAVILIGLPDLSQVYKLRVEYKTCNLIWTFACNDMVANPDAIFNRNAELRDKLMTIENITYVDLFQLELEQDQISYDCFHPSKFGQNKIGQMAWEAYAN